MSDTNDTTVMIYAPRYRNPIDELMDDARRATEIARQQYEQQIVLINAEFREQLSALMHGGAE